MPPPIHFPRKTVVDPVREAEHRQRLVQDLLALGDQAFRQAAIRRWSDTVDPVLKPLLSTMVLTRIEWHSGQIGPGGVRLAPDAFEAVHWRWQEFLDQFQPGAARWRKLRSQVKAAPLLSNGPHEPGVGRATVVLFLDSAEEQGLEIRLRPTVTWVDPAGADCLVAMAPDLRRFRRSDGVRVLPPFRVVKLPHHP